MKNKLVLICAIVLFGCNEESYIPKPKGFMRPNLPKKEYKAFSSNCPFEFDFQDKAKIIVREDQFCWFTIRYPKIQAEIHLTYKPVEDNLRDYLEQTHKLAYDHHFKANDIKTEKVINDEDKVYGLSYYLKGEVASNTQFYLTDSTNHFIRGSLYFNSKAKPDSLAPYVNYVNQDIQRFIESFRWRE